LLEAFQYIKIEILNCQQVLEEELKVDRAKVFVVLTKYDNIVQMVKR